MKQKTATTPAAPSAARTSGKRPKPFTKRIACSTCGQDVWIEVTDTGGILLRTHAGFTPGTNAVLTAPTARALIATLNRAIATSANLRARRPS